MVRCPNSEQANIYIYINIAIFWQVSKIQHVPILIFPIHIPKTFKTSSKTRDVFFGRELLEEIPGFPSKSRGENDAGGALPHQAGRSLCSVLAEKSPRDAGGFAGKSSI